MRAFLLCLLLCGGTAMEAQTTGAVRGTIRLATTKEPMHHAHVTLVPGGRSVDADAEGRFEISDLPPGTYRILARMPGLNNDPLTIRVVAGETLTVELEVAFQPVKQSITVTASGRAEVTTESFLPVTSLEPLDVGLLSAPSLGEVLDKQPGIAKRSSGPGTSRPVVRGFDGDRVLVLEDGIRTGSLSSQSGDHGEPIEANDLERIEVVRGPATLLYGSNAIGGVVNAISRHSSAHEHAHDGLTGHLSASGGTANGNAGGSGSLEYGAGRWMLWAGGSGQRTSPYQTPLGEVDNSQTRNQQGSGGLGRFGEKGFFSFGFSANDARYGVPAADGEQHDEAGAGHSHEHAVLAMRRYTYRFNGGYKSAGEVIERSHVSVSYNDYNHKELVEGEVETQFFNKQVVYRTTFEQRRRGRLSGSFGFSGLWRDYRTAGEESLAPPTVQNSFAVFGVESIDLENTRFQVGGRLEYTGYEPEGLRARGFTGFSGSAGISQELGANTRLVGNYSHSYRAPSLEELYNYGPHPGNATFEIGNPDLVRERSDGLDLSLRHESGRVRTEVNYFYYHLTDYVYLAATGATVDGLFEAEYQQGDTRYTGAEASTEVRLQPGVWLNLGVDSVRAELKESGTALPRIPPVRGRAGIDMRFGGLSVRPRLELANRQDSIYVTETPTAGYAVWHLDASYSIARQHAVHVLSASLFNIGDRLYRNHLSFIKEFAPEIGRGVRFSYTVRIF